MTTEQAIHWTYQLQETLSNAREAGKQALVYTAESTINYGRGKLDLSHDYLQEAEGYAKVAATYAGKWLDLIENTYMPTLTYGSNYDSH